jgi:hypothetical protein
MLKHTKVASGKATIALKKSIDEMAKTYYWGQEKTRRFKEQILDMFNVSCEMAQFRGKDYLTHFITGLIFTPDYPMRDNEIGIMAYTQTAYYILVDRLIRIQIQKITIGIMICDGHHPIFLQH